MTHIVEITNNRPGWLSLRLTFPNVGEIVRGHVHLFDHLMTVERGCLQLNCDGRIRTLSPKESVLISRGISHSLRALKRDTVALCEHEIRHENGELYPDAFTSDGIPVEWVQRLTVP